MVSRSLLKDAAAILPTLPVSGNFHEIREKIISSLKYNSEYSRKRYQRYITAYIFPESTVDKPLVAFSKKATNNTVRNVCLYKFCKRYPLTIELFNELFLPNISRGTLPRKKVDDYLKEKFPDSNMGVDGSRGFFEALKDANVIKTNGKNITFSYRQVDPIAFAYIIHAEFPSPGMFNISKIEKNEIFNPQLWQTKDLLEALYILRNKEIIAKVSEIDTVRQFTTKFTLEHYVASL
jgi:DNA repair protein RadC